ncbi:MAG: hypothetical protein IT422_18600 [Pirellulaceae bacterium]|nr:hypothetical protein [Pirellulaceae bacterium]
MDDFVSFGVFDKAANVDIDRRFLPHWFQPGVATFITFRTADSMPREVVEKWRAELRAWLGRRGVVLRTDEKLPTVEQLQRRIDGGREFLGRESDGGASGYNKTQNTDGGASGHIRQLHNSGSITMDDFVSFGVFGNAADVDIDRRFLPHWFQPGVATFITFRIADSIPREVVEKWRAEFSV